MKRALIYTRVSTQEQASEGQSLEVQEKLCRDFASNNDLIVTNVYIDAGKSGSDPNRPGLKAAIEECKQTNSVYAIIMQDIDRLARSTKLHLSVLQLFEDLNVRVIFLNQPYIDRGLEGKLTGTIQASVAEYLAKQTGRKAKAVMIEKFNYGIWPTYAPDGYTNVRNKNPNSTLDKNIVVIDEKRGPLWRQGFEEYATGRHTIASLTEFLIAIGLDGRKGGKLMTSIVHKVLNDSFYYGLMKFDGGEVLGKHEPLITKEVFDINQRILAKHRNYVLRPRKYNFLLRGLLTCSRCGWKYTAEWHKINSRRIPRVGYYHCSNNECKPKKYRDINDLESAVGCLLKNFQFSKDFTSKLMKKLKRHYELSRSSADDKRKTLENDRKLLETKRDSLEEHLLDNLIDHSTFKRMHESVTFKIKAVDEKIIELQTRRNFDFEAVAKTISLTHDIFSVYINESKIQKQRYIDFFFEKIIVEDGEIVDFKVNPLFDRLFLINEVISMKKWHGWQESNLRHPVLETGALPTELQPYTP